MRHEVPLAKLRRRIEPARARLAAHPMYREMASVEDIRVFMSRHVFAVWDFMALLKALQRHLTSVEPMWRAVGSARTRRLVNEMVLEEESDEVDGVPTSHFELYRAAMAGSGQPTATIDSFLAAIDRGLGLEEACAAAEVPEGARAFMRVTFATIATAKPHVIASAFTFGREDAIPSMFTPMVAAIPGRDGHLAGFERYLTRHIELDGDDHGPKAIAMLEELCGEDEAKWSEAADAAESALDARIAFWDTILADMRARRPQWSEAAD